MLNNIFVRLIGLQNRPLPNILQITKNYE